MRRQWLLLLVPVVIVTLGAVGWFVWGQNDTENVRVLVAIEDIPGRAILTADMFRVVSVADGEHVVPRPADLDEAVGRTVCVEILAGHQLSVLQLTPLEGEPDNRTCFGLVN